MGKPAWGRELRESPSPQAWPPLFPSPCLPRPFILLSLWPHRQGGADGNSDCLREVCEPRVGNCWSEMLQVQTLLRRQKAPASEPSYTDTREELACPLGISSCSSTSALWCLDPGIYGTHMEGCACVWGCVYFKDKQERDGQQAG